MNELALFAGAGGGILGGKLLGWNTVCAVEWNEYARNVLVARQNDGTLSPFPIWDDVQTFDGKQWAGRIDIITGGFPCQDISAAGKGAGIEGERSGMWKHMARIIGEVRPRFVLVENSPMLVTRGIGTVLGDLASMGFDAKWGCISAASVGANHIRDRIWILANSNSECWWPIEKGSNEQEGRTQRESTGNSSSLENTNGCRLKEQRDGIAAKTAITKSERTSWWATEPNVGRMANGVAYRTHRLKAIGNGQVPRVAATAFNILSRGV